MSTQYKELWHQKYKRGGVNQLSFGIQLELSCYQLKMNCFISKMFYASLIVITKQKTRVDSQKKNKWKNRMLPQKTTNLQRWAEMEGGKKGNTNQPKSNE